ncbi:MAG: radical SAM/SPASM family putative metalloenzyme maturase [Humidesulfovibrio sp.]|uniref:radical SAM/SPASM family putative metalloenzyme maturase n=1 Tax=Humidesulfovibrio sp. TaxID=2910988 RepID=UPI0027FB2B53|nr:radical SAM/SPASM family putative metalloenzyme maturase [Humidesulfovibrio sp.]MDQ7836477.1 radical SAM/SPASM family putative metalloenzyme maturase [Humidesulfovibrio sp.]
MSDFPRTLFIETTTRCNLACPMCVKNQPGWQGGAGDMDFALFERLAPAFGHAQAVILNGMGEPLMHPDLPRMVAFAKARMPEGGWCGLQTNALLLADALADAQGERLADELVRAGLDVACISVDPDEASLGHGPGQSGLAARAAQLLRAAAARAGRSLRLGAETVLMRGGAEALPAQVDWAAGLKLDFLLATHMLPAGREQEPLALFHPCSGAALEHFAQWQAVATARGLDLARVPFAALRFRPTGQDAELLALAGEMRESARRKGLWLNTGRLARTDYDELAQLRALFAEARRRAEAAGLDLRLPELTASSEHRCGFMRDGAAFIDWQGNASPCHFLWHAYECRIFGETKRVHPQHFGNIGQAPLEELWRGAAWTAFRAAASAGEYPACGDCDMGMCSDACGAAGAFEQDCLGVGVPCGHCPWSVGQLMCLGSEPL